MHVRFCSESRGRALWRARLLGHNDPLPAPHACAISKPLCQQSERHSCVPIRPTRSPWRPRCWRRARCRAAASRAAAESPAPRAARSSGCPAATSRARAGRTAPCALVRCEGGAGRSCAARALLPRSVAHCRDCVEPCWAPLSWWISCRVVAGCAQFLYVWAACGGSLEALATTPDDADNMPGAELAAEEKGGEGAGLAAQVSCCGTESLS
jgi:hypothetical protein